MFRRSPDQLAAAIRLAHRKWDLYSLRLSERRWRNHKMVSALRRLQSSVLPSKEMPDIVIKLTGLEELKQRLEELNDGRLARSMRVDFL